MRVNGQLAARIMATSPSPALLDWRRWTFNQADNVRSAPIQNPTAGAVVLSERPVHGAERRRRSMRALRRVE